MLRIDEYSFDLTAKAVYNINPSARQHYDNPDDLRDFMVSMAYRYQHDTTSMSTHGFQLSFYKTADGMATGCVASVSASLVDTYLREVDTRLAEPWQTAE